MYEVLTQNLDNRVWCVVRPYFISGQLKLDGICGTGFFISQHVFITAHHVLKESSFIPDVIYKKEEIWLRKY